MADELKEEDKGQEAVEAKTDAEKEYEAAWDEAGKELAEGSENGEGLSEKAPLTSSGQATDTGKDSEQVGMTDSEQVGMTDSEQVGMTGKEPAEDPHEKALRDTKAWATRLAMENAELKKTVEAFKAGEASADDVKDAQKAVVKTQADLDSAKERVYEDYPELQDLLDPIIERSSALEREVSEMKTLKTQAVEQDQHKAALDYFNAAVKPEVLKVHSDFDDILFKTVEDKRTVNNEYFEWAEKQSPALRFAAMGSSDPQDIIMAVGAFKKFKASDEAKEIKLRQEQGKKEKITNAMSLRGGGSPIPAGHKRGDPEDYDSAWNEAGSTLKKQGVG